MLLQCQESEQRLPSRTIDPCKGGPPKDPGGIELCKEAVTVILDLSSSTERTDPPGSGPGACLRTSKFSFLSM